MTERRSREFPTCTHSASTQRMELAAEADVLTLGLDAANSIKARDSIEQMLMHQAAAAHKLAMRFMAKADHQLSQVQSWNPASYQAHSVEAARLAYAAGKLMSAFFGYRANGPASAERGKAGRPGHPPASRCRRRMSTAAKLTGGNRGGRSEILRPTL